MKKKITMKLRLKRETLHNLSDQDLNKAAGGAPTDDTCEETGRSYCVRCIGGSQLSGGSCPTGQLCC